MELYPYMEGVLNGAESLVLYEDVSLHGKLKKKKSQSILNSYLTFDS